MSDTYSGVADQGSAAQVPAGEVPVDTSPPSGPGAPIGSQAPPRQGEPTEHRPSRRETIQRAFEKAEAKGRPGPAEAKAGHNQPPEETPKEKFDLRKPPPREPQHREQGRF